MERPFPAVNGQGQRIGLSLARLGGHVEDGVVPVVRRERIGQGNLVHHAVAACRLRPRRPFGHRAAKRLHVEIISEEQALEADAAADDITDNGG